MKKIFVPVILLVLAGCTTTTQTLLPFEESEITEIRSGDHESIYFDDFKLHNNVWGKENITGYSRELFTVSGASGDGFGWRWE